MFHFKSSFCSRENQSSDFMTSSNAETCKTKCILLNNSGSKHSLLMNFGQVISYYKRKDFFKEFYKNCDLKTNFRSFQVCKELSTTSIGKWNFSSKLIIFRYVIAKLSKFGHISMQTSSDFFLQRILWKFKRAWSWRPHLFIYLFIFDKKFSFVVIHKLAKFHFRTRFTSQVIH